MAVMAKWRDKTWEVSSKRVAALNGVSDSVKLNTENTDDKAGSPSTNTKAFELRSMTLDFKLASVAGCDVRAEYDSWTALVGYSGAFTLGGKRFGAAKYKLTEVSLSDTTLSNSGKILMGKITVTLVEDAPEASSKKSTKSSSKSKKDTKSKLSVTQAASTSTYSALGIGATTADKAEKKTENKAITTRDNSLAYDA